jgi:hypothetical protein
MTTIRAGLSINSPGVQKITPRGELKQLSNVLNLNEALPNPQGIENRQKQIDIQNNVHQTTVIEKNGRVIASFGENGWRHFQNNSDYEQKFSNISNSQVVNALNKKYGGSLQVHTYSNGQGPTWGDIFEKIYGHPPPRSVDYKV